MTANSVGLTRGRTGRACNSAPGLGAAILLVSFSRTSCPGQTPLSITCNGGGGMGSSVSVHGDMWVLE